MGSAEAGNRAAAMDTLLLSARNHGVNPQAYLKDVIERVHHFHTPTDLVRLGRNCERTAIAKGIRYHVHDRTIIDGNRAIVFPD